MSQAKAVAKQIGAHIRAARRERGLTLQQLGALTNLSAAFLSRIERGEAGASIANLIAVAGCFDMPLRDLFEPGGSSQPARQYSISRRAERKAEPPVKAKGYAYHHLSDQLPEPEISAFLLEFPVGGERDVVLLSHPGEEILYLLEGRIEFQIDSERFTLEAGDSVHFNCELPHMGRNIGRLPARMLMAVTPAHVHPQAHPPAKPQVKHLAKPKTNRR